MRVGAGALLVGLTTVGLAACELTEVQLAESEDVVVVEAHVRLFPATSRPGWRDEGYVFLHRTFPGPGESRDRSVEGAVVRILREDGTAIQLARSASSAPCLQAEAAAEDGTCYGGWTDLGFGPGDRVDLEIDLPEGGRLASSTRIPGGFRFTAGFPQGRVPCRLAPGETMAVSWTSSTAAWAYRAETSIIGLSAVVEDEDVPDPLELVGLAVSAADTSIAFPAEFGIFERGDLDRDLALLLQEGLPSGTEAEIAVAALDRNHVNWIRGGSFNPSGRVRIPSVVGDGTGFFGSSVVRSFHVVVGEPGIGPFPACP